MKNKKNDYSYLQDELDDQVREAELSKANVMAAQPLDVLEVKLPETEMQLLHELITQEVTRREGVLARDPDWPQWSEQVDEAKALLAQFEPSSNKVRISKEHMHLCVKLLAKSFEKNKKDLIRRDDNMLLLCVYEVLGNELGRLLNEKNLFGRYLYEASVKLI